jgi:hypothetical protein
MSEIKAIETKYNGYKFRSRLEAKWAVFFDELGVEYEYEPEGFNLPSGRRYLPDFRVKCHGKRGVYWAEPFDLYIEVKGNMSIFDMERIREFSKEYPILIVGNIPPENKATDSYAVHAYDRMHELDIYPFNYETIDGDYFAAYPAATKDGKFYLFGDDSNYIDRDDEKRVNNAYNKARQARFEHGETPENKQK